MRTVEMSTAQFDALKNLVQRERSDWPAVFSCNDYQDLWLFVSYGHTRMEERIDVRGKHAILDDIADYYVALRPGGGRFFLSDEGGYYATGEAKEQFVAFKMVWDQRDNENKTAAPRR